MKRIVLLFFLIMAATILYSQTKFNLHYQPDQKIYTVSLLPEISWTAPYNKVGSAQIVLRLSADADFVPILTSLVDGVAWIDNAYLDNPAEAPGYTYIGIAMANGPTDLIKFKKGEEVPLFCFVNALGGCPGLVELTANDDTVVQKLAAAGYNFTQHIAVLGARGNAYSGVGHSLVDCSATTAVSEELEAYLDQVRIAPLPADEQLTISWRQTSSTSSRTELVIFNASGQEVYRADVDQLAGEHQHNVVVKNWKSGAYYLVFRNADGWRTGTHNLMVSH